MECPGVTSPNQPQFYAPKRKTMCAINVTISTINITITTTSTSPSPVLKSYSNDFMFWNLQWFIWICGFLGPTPFLSLQKKYQSTQAQQGHKLGVVTLLIHKLRRRACHGCLYKICEFEPVMPFFDIFCMHFWAFEVSFKANGLSEQLVPNMQHM